jgi:hypothetical protein
MFKLNEIYLGLTYKCLIFTLYFRMNSKIEQKFEHFKYFACLIFKNKNFIY